MDALLVGLYTNDAVLRERSRRCAKREQSTQLENSIRLTVREQANALEHVLDNNGFEDVQLRGVNVVFRRQIPNNRTNLKLSVGARDADNSLVANDLRADHSHGLTLGGVDLPGHDTAARLVLGQLQLTQAAPGARTEVPNIVGDLHERARHGVQRSVSLHESIVRRKRLELRGHVRQG